MASDSTEADSNYCHINITLFIIYLQYTIPNRVFSIPPDHKDNKMRQSGKLQ